MAKNGPDLSGAYNRKLLNVERELVDIGLDIEAAVVRYLQKHDMNVTGDTMKSIRSKVEHTLNAFTLRVGTRIKHAPFLHDGTRPHWPPRAPITRWVARRFGLSGKELQKRTFLVRRKIGLKGTKGRPFLAAPVRLFRNKIARRIAKAYNAA